MTWVGAKVLVEKSGKIEWGQCSWQIYKPYLLVCRLCAVVREASGAGWTVGCDKQFHKIYWQARGPHILCSIWFHPFGASAKAVRIEPDGISPTIHCITSQPASYPEMCSLDSFVNFRPVCWNLKGGLLDPRFGGLRVPWEIRFMAHITTSERPFFDTPNVFTESHPLMRHWT